MKPELVEAVRRICGEASHSKGGLMCAADKDKKSTATIDRQKEIDRLEKDVEDLRRLASTDEDDAELERLKGQVLDFAASSTPTWAPGSARRSPATRSGPTLSTGLSMMFTDFIELHGDRDFGDDKALITGLAKFRGRPSRHHRPSERDATPSSG